MDNMSMIYEALLEFQAESVVDEAISLFAKQRIYADIDEALLRGDQITFYSLTNKLKQMIAENA